MFKVGQTVTLRNGAEGQVLAVNRPAPYDPVLVMVTKEGATAVPGDMVGMLLSYGAEGTVVNGRASVFDIVTPPKPKIKQWLVARQIVGMETSYVCILSQETYNNPATRGRVLRAVEFEYDPNDNEFTFTHPAGYFEAVDDDE